MKSKFLLLNKSIDLYVKINKTVINKIPKVHTGIKSLITKHSFLIIEYIHRARIDKLAKNTHINEIIIQINILQDLFNILKNMKLISHSKFIELTKELSEVNKLSKGWLENVL